MSRITLATMQKLRDEGTPIATLTAYDASFAALLDEAGVECLLIGDSLGMVVQGHDSTLPVTLDHMVYHTGCVARAARRAFIAADLPFGSYQASPQQAFKSAVRLMAAGAHMVKIEGGLEMADTVDFLTSRGVPVWAHIGLQPQSVNQLGGYRVQGRTADAETRILAEARALEDAGAGMLLLEAIPARLGKAVTAAAHVPTIGIGAGPDCSGQVLVLHDMLEVFPGKKARFVKNFMQGAPSIADAVRNYVSEVKARRFPAAEHSF
jgi:3-methyl-2-oxobutanoate hydroxymethyltransferase